MSPELPGLSRGSLMFFSLRNACCVSLDARDTLIVTLVDDFDAHAAGGAGDHAEPGFL